MAIDIHNTKFFHLKLYGGLGMLQTITLLKRGDDQQQGTVVSHKLFRCRWWRYAKSGETIYQDAASGSRRRLSVPRIELDRVGVNHLNALDRFIDQEGRYWQPEATTSIVVQLLQNWIDIDCVRIDP